MFYVLFVVRCFNNVNSSFANILMGKRELVALLSLSSWCLVMVVWLFLAMPCVCLRFVIVVFPDHTHSMGVTINKSQQQHQRLRTDSSLSHQGCGLNAFHWYQIYALDSAVVELQEISYFGHIFAPDGLKPSSDKFRAIIEIPEPQNRTELQRCMCTVNYLGKFIPNQLGINQMLRQFLQKNIAWHW